MNSILITIKAMLGIAPDDTAFDMELMVHINSIISVMKQIGVVTSSNVVTGPSTKWDDVFGTLAAGRMELVKTLLYLRVRLLFDPPSGSAMNSFESMAQEYEWRLYIDADNKLNASSTTSTTDSTT